MAPATPSVPRCRGRNAQPRRATPVSSPAPIVVAPDTRRLLGQSFDVEDLGDHDLKGIDSPVRLNAFAVPRVAKVASTLPAAGGTRPSLDANTR